MRFLTAGESHGERLLGIVDGFPAGHRISLREIERDLARRRESLGRSARQTVESDSVEILSGLWRGRTTGAPIALSIVNLGRRELGKPGGGLGRVPRPGHADLAGCLKYGLDEVPPIAERASARGTAMRVAIGSLAKGVLKTFSVEILGHVISIGGIDAVFSSVAFDGLRRRVLRSPLYCADKDATDRMAATIREAKTEGSSLGGAVEVIVTGILPGLGSHAEWDRKLDARLAGAMMSIQSVKAVEVGDGLDTCKNKGHETHDEMRLVKGRIKRRTNSAGGIEGGMSNGEDIVVRLFAKPLPTSSKRLSSFDMKTLRPKTSPSVRSDVCAIPALSVIAEATAAWEILCVFAEKFGGDSVYQMKTNVDAYISELNQRGIR